MANINWPTSPTLNQTYTSDSGVTWRWDGAAWVSLGSGQSSYTLPVATSSVLGGVKIGSGITVGVDGTISVTGASGSSYTLPAATSSVLGGIKVGQGLGASADGTLSIVYNESKAIYVDSTYGNNATAAKYSPTRPYTTWTAAIAVATSGDWIVFNAGSYSGTMTVVSGVNVYCKPGAQFSGGFSVTSAVTWRLHGFAEFVGGTVLSITSSGASQDIYFEFDRVNIVGANFLTCNDLSSPMIKLNIKGTSIYCDRAFYLNSGSSGTTYDLTANISHIISGAGNRIIMCHGNFLAPPGPMYGSVVINCPIIESTNSENIRSILYFVPNNTNNFQMYINATVIRSTSASFTDSGANNVACMFYYSGGDNININANVECGELPCIINHSAGNTYVTGNFTLTGNINCKREIVQQYAKLANGNGWHNVTIRDGYITSTGQGLSNAMFHRASNWISAHGGLPGDTKLLNCTIFNQNTGSSSTAAIIRDDGPDVGKNNNFQFYNCLAFVGATGYLASSAQAAKFVSMHNVRSNRSLDTTVSDQFSPTGLIVDSNLTIPKTNI